ncbi:hypothetical protein MA16_Dca025425 [Dendrobium catenatum]|uniref:Uncharacterized protein n=1 Tax=Dendrobium catenatum TaxID=906689 RepID=A0A2I0XBH4_9ASPA|nr:hypothetical protein MA16_Dca025425 [Dendrobium catenatum]
MAESSKRVTSDEDHSLEALWVANVEVVKWVDEMSLNFNCLEAELRREFVIGAITRDNVFRPMRLTTPPIRHGGRGFHE